MLPKQVQAQLDAADKLFATPAAPAEPVTQPQAETTETAPAPQPAPEPAPAPAPSPEPVPQDDPRYRVLKGKYDAEVPALHAERRELAARNAQLLAEVERLRQASEQPQPTPRAPEGATAKDIDDFGSEMVAMVQRVTGSVVAELAGRFDAELRAIREQIGTVDGRQKLTAQQQFDKDLDALVADWREVDTEAEWLEWLAQPDTLSGQVRQTLLNVAAESLDAKRVAAVFNAYKATKPAPAAPTPPPAPRTTDPALAKQVAPSRASAPTPPSAPEASIWTDAAIQAFYDDVRKGKFKGREDEYNRIDADLTAAIAEGRYRPR